MRGWTRPADVRAALTKEWDSGRLLASRVEGAQRGTAFPLRVAVRGPRSRDVAEQFDAVRAWAAEINAIPHGRVESVALANRVLGTQTLPAAVWFDRPEQALALIGRTRAAAAFDRLVDTTPPQFRPVVAAGPLRVLEAAPDWPAIVAAAQWIADHPAPGIYLREVDIPGVHSKVLERHRRLIAALVDQVRPAAPDVGGSHWFERRYGFRTKPALVRFRQLDPEAGPLPGLRDVTLPVAEFAALSPQRIRRVFVTENEINFLTFPAVAASLVVFGSGNEAPELLGGVPWLRHVEVHYWGDIDTHGFAILDRFRARLPRTRSLLMDTGTLLAHRDSWGSEPKQISRDLPSLTDAEAAVYGALLRGEHGEHVRLEQEFIGFGHVQQTVAECASQ
jgi:hypothetical protein